MMAGRNGNRWHDGEGRLLFEGDEWAMLNELVRLRAIEAKLPKTKDGVAITAGMDVVTHMMTSGWHSNPVLGMFRLSGALWLDMGRGAKILPCECYSTLEAVEAAGEQS